MLKVLRIFLWAVVVTAPRRRRVISGLERQSGAPVQPMVAIGGRSLAATTGGTIDSMTLKAPAFAVAFSASPIVRKCVRPRFYEMSSTLAKLGDDAKDFKVFLRHRRSRARHDRVWRRAISTSFDPRIIGLRPSPE